MDNDTENGRQKNRRVVIFVPVLKDKARVMEAIRKLGDRMNRGVTFDKPASPESREGIRNDIQEPAPEIIRAPLSENRFYNAAPPVVKQESIQQLPSTRAPVRLTTPVDQVELSTETGERHIGRQPIEGIRVPSASSEIEQ